MRAVAGQFEYDEIIRARGKINDSLCQTVGPDMEKWGASCTKFEIGNFRPKNEEIAKQLELQMEAERKKRENELNTQAAVRTSEGKKQSAILESEGNLISQENNANAQYIISQKEADAQKYTIDAVTDALTRQLDEVSRMFNENREYAAKYILEQKQLEHLKALSQTNNKIYFMESNGMLPTAQTIADMFATNTQSTTKFNRQDTSGTHNSPGC
jgi:regulator of protease activity HflC (stomatin/prohibitin superfamily)